MHTSRFLVLLGLAAAGCGYSMPTDDAEYRPTCFSPDSCPDGWTCGSAWVDGDLCNTSDRGSMRDGKIVVSDGSVIWGYDCPESCIPFTCIEGATPVAAVGMYCYQNAPTCGSLHCSPGQKCGMVPAPGPLVMECLDPGSFAAQVSDCGSCPLDHPSCRIVLEATTQYGNSYTVCTNLP